MRKTKIVCTLGPGIDDYQKLVEMCNAGMNVARINFSHGDYEEQSKRIELFKRVREDLGLPIPLLLDTKGPEIRIGKFENDEIYLNPGTEFTFMHDECIGNGTRVYVNYADLYKDVGVGSTILVNDGLIELQVIEISNKNVRCLVKNGGKLSNRKSVNVPGLSLNLPLLGEKDRQDIIFGIQNGFDIIAVSFVRKADDILAIKEVLRENHAEDIKIISKIENIEGIENFEKILEVSDGIMVARGDLSVEVPMDQVPMLQKKFIKRCLEQAKTVIVATQMLESMVTNPRPTRAEVSDVANAVLDGTSAIMLSGESATGKYPVECVKMMSKITETVEKQMDHWSVLNHKTREGDLLNASSDLIIGHSLCEVAMQTKAKSIFSLSAHGNTPKAIASFRPNCDIFAITPIEKTARQMNLTWGVTPILVDKDFADQMLAKGISSCRNNGYVRSGEVAIISGSDTYDYHSKTAFKNYKTIGGICII